MSVTASSSSRWSSRPHMHSQSGQVRTWTRVPSSRTWWVRPITRRGGAMKSVVTVRRLGPTVAGMSRMPDPHAFADEWIAAWNARDLDRVLSHYAADAVVTTPFAAVRVPDSGGVV